MLDLLKDTKVTQAITPTAGAAGTTDINGAELDMSGYEGVMAIVTFGAITAGAVTSIKMQQDTATGMSSAADLAGTAQTVADSDDDKVFIINLHRPRERFVRLVVDRGTQNAVVASATYVQYGASTVPTTQGTGVAGSESHVSPAEGTA